MSSLVQRFPKSPPTVPTAPFDVHSQLSLATSVLDARSYNVRTSLFAPSVTCSCVTGVLQSDGCRLSQLRCHTAKSGHIYNKFSWGNRKSLFDEPKARGVAVRDELVQYYRCAFLF